MEQLELIQKQCDVLKQEVDVLSKSTGLEFQKIAGAIGNIGNLLDFVYLEISVLLETLVKNKVVDQAEFVKTLEETAKKVESEIEAARKVKDQKEESPIITKV